MIESPPAIVYAPPPDSPTQIHYNVCSEGESNVQYARPEEREFPIITPCRKKRISGKVNPHIKRRKKDEQAVIDQGHVTDKDEWALNIEDGE